MNILPKQPSLAKISEKYKDFLSPVPYLKPSYSIA